MFKMSVFKPIKWDECRSWDDVIPIEEKSKISELEKKLKNNPHCPCLKKEGRYFYYCGVKVPVIGDKRISPFNLIYLNRCILPPKMGFCCIPNFEGCPTYVGYLKRTKK